MEQPNLKYIEQLARGEESIKKTLIGVIKTEFPDEIRDYFSSIERLRILKESKIMFIELNINLVS